MRFSAILGRLQRSRAFKISVFVHFIVQNVFKYSFAKVKPEELLNDKIFKNLSNEDQLLVLLVNKQFIYKLTSTIFDIERNTYIFTLETLYLNENVVKQFTASEIYDNKKLLCKLSPVDAYEVGYFTGIGSCRIPSSKNDNVTHT